MQRVVAERSARYIVKADNQIIGEIKGKMEPKD
jgi:hypothetical protein